MLHHRAGQRALAAGLILAIGCGPDLTSAASTDVTGQWLTAAVIRGVDSITLDLSQSASGGVAGEWGGVVVDSAAYACTQAPCPPPGDIVGSHTVLQLFMAMDGLGSFTGQLVTPDSLHGTHTLDGEHKPIGFSRVTP